MGNRFEVKFRSEFVRVFLFLGFWRRMFISLVLGGKDLDIDGDGKVVGSINDVSFVYSI